MENIEFEVIQLQLDNHYTGENLWIEAWYDLPNGNCVAERFVVLESGQPTYSLINKALELFGKEVLNAQLNSLQMSPDFAGRYLYPTIVQHHHQAHGIDD
jgi:hypothetical protein